MIDWIVMTGALMGGVCLGLFYFGGLWWTVSRIRSVDNPIVMYSLSLFVRGSIVLGSLFCILQVGVVPMLLALIGMVVTRVVLVRRLGLVGNGTLESNFQSRVG